MTVIRPVLLGAVLALAACEGVEIKPLPPEDRPEIANPLP